MLTSLAHTVSSNYERRHGRAARTQRASLFPNPAAAEGERREDPTTPQPKSQPEHNCFIRVNNKIDAAHGRFWRLKDLITGLVMMNSHSQNLLANSILTGGLQRFPNNDSIQNSDIGLCYIMTNHAPYSSPMLQSGALSFKRHSN